uniref:Ectonucleoside triphosphate diphosphohydrolase 1 n=1 Tax=Hucho hucho TaxID=62062 RepID=A0A4W5QXT2_9TELE
MQARPTLPCTSTSGRLINKMALALSLSTASVMLRKRTQSVPLKNDRSEINTTEVFFHRGGISSYAEERGGAGSSLEPCLEQALQDIPKSRHRLTPVYLGATAGMRLLNISNPTESEQILKDVGSKLHTYPFDFRAATILSGQEEGAYGWVTVNYLLENFIKVKFIKFSQFQNRHQSCSRTLGNES